MGKKIVILNGSPRRNGNTSALTAVFAKGKITLLKASNLTSGAMRK